MGILQIWPLLLVNLTPRNHGFKFCILKKVRKEEEGQHAGVEYHLREDVGRCVYLHSFICSHWQPRVLDVILPNRGEETEHQRDQ